MIILMFYRAESTIKIHENYDAIKKYTQALKDVRQNHEQEALSKPLYLQESGALFDSLFVLDFMIASNNETMSSLTALSKYENDYVIKEVNKLLESITKNPEDDIHAFMAEVIEKIKLNGPNTSKSIQNHYDNRALLFGVLEAIKVVCFCIPAILAMAAIMALVPPTFLMVLVFTLVTIIALKAGIVLEEGYLKRERAHLDYACNKPYLPRYVITDAVIIADKISIEGSVNDIMVSIKSPREASTASLKATFFSASDDGVSKNLSEKVSARYQEISLLRS